MEEAAAPAPRKRRRPREAAMPDTPDPVEIAMAAAGSGRKLPDAARSLLEKHGRLIDAQVHELHLNRIVARLRVSFWTGLSLAGLAALLFVVILIWRLVHTDALVVEAFRVPPALAEQGLSGEVMATRVMDQMALMQSRTLSTRPPSSFSTDWGNDIKVEIPNTGATLGDVRRLLIRAFGQETRISGEAVRDGIGWTVTARVSGRAAIAASGPQLEPLVSQVAEGIFRQTQPYRHVVYLVGAGRSEEAFEAARQLSLNGPEEERPWGLVAQSMTLDYPDYGNPERLPIVARAAAAVPDFPMPTSNYAGLLEELGHWEPALAQYRRAVQLIGDGSRISEEFRGQFLAANSYAADGLTGAFADAAERAEAAGRVGTPAFAVDYVRFSMFARYALRDIAAGDRNHARLLDLIGWTQTNDMPLTDSSGHSGIARAMLSLESLRRVERARRLGDRAALARLLPVEVARLKSLLAGADPRRARDMGVTLWPRIAPALASIGQGAEAEALLAPLPGDCYPCLVARGEVAAARGDAAAARSWLARARALGPSLPFADEALGRLLLARGRAAEAASAFQQALAAGPRFADALKGLGDALAAQGDHDRAAARYADAARHAPRWGALHIAWGDALARAGERESARQRYAMAAGMALSAADRARLARRLG